MNQMEIFSLYIKWIETFKGTLASPPVTNSVIIGLIFFIESTRWFWRERSQGCKVTFDARFCFHSKITRAGTGLIKGCNRRKCILLFIHWNGLHIAEVLDVCNWIQFGRDCKDWKSKDLTLKWYRQRIWLWGKTGQQNSSSRLNLIGC